MERVKIKAESRDVSKGALNLMRKGGQIPAILYGRGNQPQGLTLNNKELIHAMKSGGLNAVLELELGQKKGPVLAMLKEYQSDPVSRQILHVDLLRIDLKEKVSVRVPIHVTGKSIGVEKGGVLDITRRELEVQCLPTKIPEKIEVDVSPLDIGDSIHLNDLKLPEGVEVPHEVNFNIVSVAAPRKEEPAAEVAPAVEPGAVPATEVAEPTAAPAEAEKGKEKAKA